MLDPESLAGLFAASVPAVEAALAELETRGLAIASGAIWRVADGGSASLQTVLNRVAPVLRAVVALAVARITPAEAAAVLSAYDRFAGLSADSGAAARAQGYRDLMQHLAEASGSSFHAQSLADLLVEARPLIDQFIARQMASARTAEPDSDLGRLARAMMQSSPTAAEAALEDHLASLQRTVDRQAQSGP